MKYILNNKRSKIFASPYRNEANPYTEEFYRHFDEFGYLIEEYSFRSASKVKNQIVHYHWPEYSIFKSSKWATCWSAFVFYIQVAYLRYICGHIIVWTCHNVLPHGRDPSRARIFMKPMARLCQKVIYLSEKNKLMAESVYPKLINTDSCVIRLGVYPVEQLGKKTPNKEELRFLTFGLIRKYKGVDLLVEAFNHWCLGEASAPASLTIIGKCGDVEHKKQINHLASQSENVDVRFNFISEDELRHEIDQCNAAIFTFRNIVNSSSAIRSLSQGKRVIAPRLGSLIELQNDFGSDLVFLFDELCTQTFEEVVKWLKHDAEVRLPEIYQPRYITQQIDKFLNNE